MGVRKSSTRRWVSLGVLGAALVGMGLTQAVSGAATGDEPVRTAAVGGVTKTPPVAAAPLRARPAYVAERSEAAMAATTAAPLLAPGQPGEHPLMPVLRWANNGLDNLEKIPDYSATVVKRERIGGKVREYEFMFVKIRQKPFSVYMCFLGPAELKGQECMFVEGKENGNMLAHAVGLRGAIGTVPLKPDGPIAMQNQRYPLTEIGILNMTKRLVEVGEKDKNYGECEVKFYDPAKIRNGRDGYRVCTCIEVIHPVPRRNFLFHLARIFVDKELNLPIRYESYDWPKQRGGKPELLEEYTYMNLKLNNGYTDLDFDVKNPKYNFYKH
jgi:hypothetical protein